MSGRIFSIPTIGACAQARVFLKTVLCCGFWMLASIANAQENHMLYFFTNDGCAPCKLVVPVVNQLKSEGFPVTIIKASQHPDWVEAFRASQTPALYLTRGNRVLNYHFGVMRKSEILNWFSAAGVRSGGRAAGNDLAKAAPSATQPPQKKISIKRGNDTPLSEFKSSTLHQGTSIAASSIEAKAIAATVRLKVEDDLGISFATGTVVHRHGGESLVVTCGHVFRESQGKGKITAEFGFSDGRVVEVPGQLLDYDANAKDIALVQIQNGIHEVEVVPVAMQATEINRGNKVFSIGCDHGKAPTIRRTAIKNIAYYDKALKYDIFGRPVNGRSGGGLFNHRGELVGVCNAAAVEVDEGVYSALETIRGQIAQNNLEHLFDGQARSSIAAAAPRSSGSDAMVDLPRSGSGAPSASFASAANPISKVSLETPVSSSMAHDREVTIMVQSKTNAGDNRLIRIPNPTRNLINYLESMDDTSPSVRSLNVASWREPIFRLRK